MERPGAQQKPTSQAPWGAEAGVQRFTVRSTAKRAGLKRWPSETLDACPAGKGGLGGGGGGVAGEIAAGLAGVMGRTVFAALADPVNTGSVSAAEARPKAWAGRGEA